MANVGLACLLAHVTGGDLLHRAKSTSYSEHRVHCVLAYTQGREGPCFCLPSERCLTAEIKQQSDARIPPLRACMPARTCTPTHRLLTTRRKRGSAVRQDEERNRTAPPAIGRMWLVREQFYMKATVQSLKRLMQFLSTSPAP